MSPKATIGLFIAGVILLIVSQSLYVVNETERAIKLQFGEVVQSDIQPGVHFKTPFIQNIRRYDARVITLDSNTARFLTSDKRYVMVDFYAQWRILNVRDFYRATAGQPAQAFELISNLLTRSLRDEVASRNLTQVVSGERDELMDSLVIAANEESKSRWGIEVLDLRIKAIDLPEDLSASVYQRMSAERQREAREQRSEGTETAEGTRARADRERVVIEAEAFRDAERLRGEGDALAARIYADAYNKDPEFYAFTRSLRAYVETFKENDMILLKPDSEFFRYLKSATGK
ncbi:MAG: protease modulator HflC [Bacterioplanes sp.]|nr:protease modulator HflC [Bacterioplanes sp.]